MKRQRSDVVPPANSQSQRSHLTSTDSEFSVVVVVFQLNYFCNSLSSRSGFRRIITIAAAAAAAAAATTIVSL